MTLKYDHLVGLTFNMSDQNCYTILRSFYRDNFGIDLTDYACPSDWTSKDFNLYSTLAETEGFYIVHEHPRDWRAGDVILMAIESSTGNHVAVLLDNGQILHHLYGQRSSVTPYGGMFRNNTVGVYRHRDVPAKTAPETLLDIRAVLPPHVLRRLEEIEKAQDGAA